MPTKIAPRFLHRKLTGQLKWIQAVAVSPITGQLYVATLDNGIVTVSPDLSSFQQFVAPGKEAGQVSSAKAIAFDEDGNTVIVAEWNRVSIFANDGKFIRCFGSKGKRPGELECASSVAVNDKGLVIVVDSHNHRLQIWQRDGAFVRAFGRKGIMDGELYQPASVALLDADRLVVSDTFNHRLQVHQTCANFNNLPYAGVHNRRQVSSHYQRVRKRLQLSSIPRRRIC